MFTGTMTVARAVISSVLNEAGISKCAR